MTQEDQMERLEKQLEYQINVTEIHREEDAGCDCGGVCAKCVLMSWLSKKWRHEDGSIELREMYKDGKLVEEKIK